MACLCAASCSKSETYTLLTYNVGVFHKYTENSTPMVAAMMHELNADIISMNELDSMTIRTGGHYQLEEFAAEMGEGWDFNYTRAMPYNGGAYGIGIATGPRFKINESYDISLGKYDGSENRAMSVVETDKLIYASVHLDHKSKSAQLQQAKNASEWLCERYKSTKKPVFLCGDFNALPDSETISYIKENWTMLSSDSIFTHDSENPDIVIDYIFILNNGAKYEFISTDAPTAFKNGDPSEASDHLPVYVRIKL